MNVEELTLVMDGAPARSEPEVGRRGKHAILFDSRATREGKRDWYAVWMEAGRPVLPEGNALWMELQIELARPGDHFNTKGELNAKGKRSPRPLKKPDNSNILKLVEDSLNKRAWADDRFFVEQKMVKLWASDIPGSPSRTIVKAGLLEI